MPQRKEDLKPWDKKLNLPGPVVVAFSSGRPQVMEPMITEIENAERIDQVVDKELYVGVLRALQSAIDKNQALEQHKTRLESRVDILREAVDSAHSHLEDAIFEDDEAAIEGR